MRIFKIPEDAPEGKKISRWLLVGLLSPFLIVTLFLVIFSRKIDLTSSVLKPGIPSAPVASTPHAGEGAASKAPPLPIVPHAEVPPPIPIMKQAPSQGVLPPAGVSSVPKGTLPKKPDQNLTFFKTLKESPAIKGAKEGKIKKAGSPPRAVPAPTAKGAEGVTTPVATETPTATAPADVKPLAPALGRFTIQVGSFSRKEDADRLALRLNDHGHAAYVVMANVLDKGAMYRVRVGKYQDRPLALDAAEKLSRAEQLSFIITSDP